MDAAVGLQFPEDRPKNAPYRVCSAAKARGESHYRPLARCLLYPS